MLRIPLLAAAALTALGSSEAVAQRQRTTTVYFDADARTVRVPIAADTARVWAALPRAFRELGYPGGPGRGSGERVFLTPYLRVPGSLYAGEPNSRYLDCGPNAAGGPAADTHSITFSILARVVEEPDGGSTLELLISGRARDRAASSTGVRCSGTGRLERALGEIVARHARAGAQAGGHTVPVPVGDDAAAGQTAGESLETAAAAADGPPRLTPEWENRIRQAVIAEHPHLLRDAGVGGRVVVRFRVTAEGHVDPGSIAILSRDHELFGQAARRLLRRLRFVPAHQGGEPVPARMRGEITWAFDRSTGAVFRPLVPGD